MKFRDGCLLLICLLLAGWPSRAWPTPSATPPVVMLATPYRAGIDVPAYWVSEKLDGVRARWDGQRLQTRSGQPITPPRWFTRGWPRMAIDGELWLGAGRFDDVVTPAALRTVYGVEAEFLTCSAARPVILPIAPFHPVGTHADDPS